jgi:hypothetical protein
MGRLPCAGFDEAEALYARDGGPWKFASSGYELTDMRARSRLCLRLDMAPRVSLVARSAC